MELNAVRRGKREGMVEALRGIGCVCHSGTAREERDASSPLSDG